MRFWEAVQKMLNEISEENLEKIELRAAKFAAKNFKNQPFNDIFGDKSRLVIPIRSEQENNFLRFLTTAGLSKINPIAGTAVRKTQTQKGDKEQPIRIGKFLQFASKQDDEAKEWLEWWEKNKDKMDKDKGVSVVISRNPIDVIRMSDHREIQSCHSEGDSWFRCAVQEAKTGGAVAMVVRNRDLEGLDLDKDEIFADKKRKIDGIEPMERIRLRRFEDDNHDYLVPELRTYGIKHVGTAETVSQWANEVQHDKLKNVDWEKLKLRGGAYQDNDADELWNNLLGTDKFSGTKNSEDQSTEEKDGVDAMQNRADELIRAKRFKHFHVDAEAENIDGRPYLSISVNCYFEFPMDQIINFDKDDYKSHHNIDNIIRKDVGIHVVEYVNYSVHDNKLIISLSIRDEDDDGTIQGLERVLDSVKLHEDDYEEHKEAMVMALIKAGVMEDPIDDLDLQHLEEIEREKFKYSSEGTASHPVLNNAKFSFIADAEIGDFSGLPKSAVIFKKNGFIYSRRNRGQWGSTTVADFYLGNKLKTSLNAQLSDEEKEVLKGHNFEYRLEFVSHEDQDEHSPKDMDVHPHEEFDKGQVFVVLDVDMRNYEGASILKKLDNLWPEIVREAKKDWEHFKSDAGSKDDTGISKSTRSYLNTLAAGINNQYNLEGGSVAVRDVGGLYKYWYENKNLGISVPFEHINNLLRELNRIPDRFEVLGRKGEVAIKNYNGSPVAVWVDSVDGEATVKDATEKYEKEIRDRVERARAERMQRRG